MERILVEGLQNIRVVGFDLLTKGADGQDVVIPDALVKIASGEMEVFSGGEPVSITDIMSASNLSLDQVENVFLENILTESGSGSGEGTQSTQKEAEQKDALPDETELRLQQLAEEAARLEALKEDIEAKEEALAAREKQLDEDEEVAAENASTASNRLDGALNVDAIAEETSEEGGVLPNPELAEAQGDTTQKSTESGSGFKKILPQPQIQQVVVSSSSAPSSKSSNVEEKKEEVKLTVTLSADTDSGVTGDFITNVAQGLTFVGTSNPGASISMSLNGAVELATADNAGAWSVTIVSTLPDGTYTALVTTTTLLGGTATTNKTLVIDTQSPVQPDARLSASSDTGDSDTDTITFDSKATFIGQGEANTTIELTIDGRVYKEKVGADGQWSMTVTTALFDEIDKEYQVVSVDVAGNRSAELTATLTVDTQLNFDGRLTALLDSNVVGDDITNQVNPTFSGTGDDAAAVVLVLNGLEWQTNVGRDGAWFIDPEMQLEDGRYEYSLTSKDLAGNTKTLASTLVIDTQPPVLTARLDAESDTGNSDSDSLTKDVQPKFSGVTEAAISINLSIDGKSYQTTSDSNGDWYIQMSDSLSPGNYEYTVIAMDLAGNQTLVTHEITIDTVTSLSGGLDSASDSGVSADDYLTNVQTPLFSGSGEAQATVVVTINDTEYSTQVGMNGLWSLQITDLLEPGEYTYRILATDLAGNQSPLIEHTMTVDISTAVTAQLDTLSDSGRSDDDAVTRLTKPTLSGTGEAGARLTLTVEGDVISDNIVVDENGEWQFAFVDDLVDGRYSYQVDAVDSAGNSATTGQAFVIDTLIPASFTAAMENASDSGASSSDYITNATNPIFSGTSEADSDVTLAIYQGDNLVSSDSVRVTSSESWTLAVTDSLADGVYRFEVSAKDAAGNQTDSVSHALTIDTVAELTGGLASFSDLGQSSTDNLTKDAAPTFSGTGEAGASVSLTIGGETYTTTVNAGRDWSILVPVTLVDGAYDYQLNTVDLAGNTLSDDQRLTGRIEIDTLPPESFTGRLDAQSDSGSDSNDQLTNNTQPDFTGTVEPGSTVTLDIAGQNVSAAATVDDAGNWHVNVPLELSDAVYQYSLTAEDAAGNASLLTGEFTLDTDTQITGGLLATSDSGESDSDNLTKNTTPVFGGTAEPGASVVLTINSQNYSTVVPLSGGWAITVSDVLPEGEFDYTVVATDKAGNTAQKTGSITIDTSLFVTAKLDSASDSGESSSDALTKVNTPTISGTAEAGAVINLSIAGASYSVIANSDQSWSIDVTSPLADGDIVYTVQATDKAGNTVSVDNGLTVDTQAPLFSGGLSVGSDSGSSSLDGVTNDTRPVFSGMSEVGATVSLTIADNDYQVVVDANGEWRIAIEAVMDDGEYDYNATSIDAAGNTSTLSGRVVIDTLINFTGGLDAGSDTGSSSSDAITQATKPTFSGTGERGAQVSLEIDGATYLTTVQSNGTWAVAVDQSLADAIHAYRLISTDAAGNQKIINSSVTIDTTSPLLLTGGLSVSSDTGISYQDGVTSNTTPSFLGTVEQGAQVTMTLNGVLYDTVVDDQGSWRVDTVSALPDGQYDYQISAVDAAGNQRVLNQGLTIDTKTTLSGGLEANSDTGDSNTDKLTKLVQPEFSGNAETGAQIALTIANQTYSTTVTEAGTWLVKVTNALTDGGHDYTVTSTDIAGNQATISGNIEVDSTTAVTARLKSSSDTGESNTDGVTNSNKPTFNGTGENGASIRLDIGDESYETTVDDAGKWSLQVSQALGDGDYSYTAIATDVAGNSAQVSADITIDTQAPTPLTANLAGASDSGQSSTDNITKETTPTLQGTGEANARIVVVMDNTSFTTTVSSTGNWSLSLPERTMNGTYAYQVTQTDLAGNVSLLTRSFVLDTTAPTIQGGLVQQDDSGRSNSDSMTNVNTPTFKGIAEPSANISLLINATEYPTTADSNGNWSVQVTEALPDGDFDYVISAEDVAGNSASINGAMTVDTISPLNVTAVLEQSSDTGASFDDNLTKATMPFIAGTAETGAQVVLTLNGQQYSATASSGVWRVQVSESLSDGEHIYSVVATDAAGNQTQPVTGSFIVDTSTFVTGGLLASSDTGISNSDNLTQIDTPTFVGTTEVGASVVLVINGYSYEAMVDTQGNWQVEIPAAQPLSEGGHSYTMTATDLAGNAAVTTNTVVVDTTSPTPFTLTLAQASDSAEKGDSLTNDNTPTIVGTGEPGARIEVTAGNQVKNTTVNDSGTWSVILDSLDDGLVTIAAKAIDDAGNESTTSLDITVDTTTQLTVGLSSGSDLGFENNDGITSQTQPTFIGTAEVNATIALTINDETYTTTVDNQGNWRITVSDNLPEGDHSYRATVTDKAGNSVEANGQVTVDTTAPTPFTGGLDSASDSGISNSDKLTNVTQPTFSGTGEVGSRVRLTLDNQSKTVSVDEEGNWSITIDSALTTSGNYPYALLATDVAGNSKSLSGSFTLDTTINLTGGLDYTSDTGLSFSDGLTRDTTPTFSGSADANATVMVTVSGQEYVTTATSNGRWSLTVEQPLTDDINGTTYPYTIDATDAAGNQATQIHKNFTLDLGNPTPFQGALAANSDTGAPDGVTSDSTPTFTGIAETGSSVKIEIDGATFNATVTESGNWSVSVPFANKLSDGTHVYRLIATDKAGNESTIEDTLTIDTLAPALTATLSTASDSGDANNDGLTNITTPSFNGTTQPGALVELTINGVSYLASMQDNGNWTAQVTNALAQDDYHYVVTASDLAGNISTISGDIRRYKSRYTSATALYSQSVSDVGLG
ncbi:Ig-like domain-containing protein [Marinomonas sp. IMCC 4694]|uniref:Ig-like domain-containing protein n=1 Tax=Marinomonas sp. IMCC 4694 TaxID=2605432 RepID=UPI0011E667E2|nr:Ig-like domain-containing protein [Marinomonas sp. IMCC 4694]TYL48410.1 hypothetical protein FXV75_10925 [Marinomonas sp. IMCC 4694]